MIFMSEVKIISFNPDAHMDVFIQMYIEYITWFSDNFIEYNNIDIYTRMATTIKDYVNDNLEPYISMRLPKGTLQLLEVDGEIAGMGVMHKIGDETGEIKRMYVFPKFRRRGLGRMMVNELLKIGKSIGCNRFLLDSPKFATPAHSLYRSIGFIEVEPYPESEIPVDWNHYWIFMEKTE